MTPDTLRAHTRKELATLARHHHVDGWHAMRKEELIEALIGTGRGLRSESKSRPRRADRARGARLGDSIRPRRAPSAATNGRAAADPPAAPLPRMAAAPRRPMLVANVGDGPAADRLTVREADPYWLHACWTLSPAALRRAEAALGYEWHQAVPVLRVFDVTSEDGATPMQNRLADVEIHGAADHWYVPVENPPRSYQVQLGYRTRSGRFFALARSHVVKTTRPGGQGTSGKSWNQPAVGASARPGHGTSSEEAVEHLAEILRARAASLADDGSAAGRAGGAPAGYFPFHVDVELIVHGSVQRGAQVCLMGERVAVEADGSFALHLPVPSGRLVIPAAAVTPDGAQRMIVVGIERNTKELEPQAPDGWEH